MLGLNGFDTSPGWYMNSVMNWWIANLNWCTIFWSNCAIAMNLPKFVIFVNPCWRQLVEVDFIRFIQRVLDLTEFTGLTFNPFKSCTAVYCPRNNEESNNLKIILKWKEKSFEPNLQFGSFKMFLFAGVRIQPLNIALKDLRLSCEFHPWNELK